MEGSLDNLHFLRLMRLLEGSQCDLYWSVSISAFNLAESQLPIVMLLESTACQTLIEIENSDISLIGQKTQPPLVAAFPRKQVS